MIVELERISNALGERKIRLQANDTTTNPATINEWIATLKLAKEWLQRQKKPKEEVNKEPVKN